MRILRASKRLTAAVVLPLIASVVYAANVVPEGKLLGTKLLTPVRSLILRLGPPELIGSAPCASDDIYGILKQVLEQQGVGSTTGMGTTGAAGAGMTMPSLTGAGGMTMPGLSPSMPTSPMSSPMAAMGAGMLGTQVGPTASGTSSTSTGQTHNMIEYPQATYYANSDDIIVRIASVKNTGKYPAAKTLRGVKQGDMFDKVIKVYGWPKRFAAEGQYYLLDYPNFGLRFGFKVNKVIYIESVIL